MSRCLFLPGLVVGLFTRVVHRVNEGLGSLPVRAAANHFMKRYGYMTSLKIDSAAKVIEAEVMLKGETAPITVVVSGYTLDGGVFRAREVKVSREWMEVLAKEVLAKGVPLPPEIGKWAGLVL